MSSGACDLWSRLGRADQIIKYIEMEAAIQLLRDEYAFEEDIRSSLMWFIKQP